MEVGLWDRGWRECSGILTELTEKGFGLMLFLKTFENLDVFSHGRMMCVHFFITSPRFSPSHQVLQSGVGWEGGGVRRGGAGIGAIFFLRLWLQ